jgi:hypothetical protein
MPFEEWVEEVRSAWEQIQQQPRVRPDMGDCDLWPFLHCSSEYYQRYFVSDRYFAALHTEPPGRSWEPELTVWNSGSFPSWTCHVEVLENPGGKLKARTVVSLQPNETAVVTLKVTTGAEGTTLIGRCYDPVLDPLEPGDPSGRKSTPMAAIMTPTAGRRDLGSMDRDILRELRHP